MSYLLACASHSPIMNNPGAAPRELEEEVAAAYRALAQRIEAFDPDLIVLFGTDHASTFALKAMPPACVGINASSLGDYDLPPGPVRTDPAFGAACIEHLHAEGVDVAGSLDMTMDHGFTQILHVLFGRYDRYPILPVFLNNGSLFRIPPHRALALGESIGRFAKKSGKRVVFLGSGGLSHDPPTPTVSDDMSPAVRARLVEGVVWTDDMLKQRTAAVYAAIREYSEGRSKLQPLSPEWDARFLATFCSGDLAALGRMTDEEIRREGGRGGGEIRGWIAAAGAMAQAQGPFRASVDYHRPVAEWMTGMAIAHADPVA
jgi:2,3-dihydroxyphenylpropionate 1,2-dioxygenase